MSKNIANQLNDDASSIQGIPVNDTYPTDKQALVYSSSVGQYVPETIITSILPSNIVYTNNIQTITNKTINSIYSATFSDLTLTDTSDDSIQSAGGGIFGQDLWAQNRIIIGGNGSNIGSAYLNSTNSGSNDFTFSFHSLMEIVM